MVPWTHWREPRLGRLLTVLTSEFTHFNPVIRLSKGKQPAFFLRFTPSIDVLNNVPLYLASILFVIFATVSCEKPPFFHFARETDRSHSTT